MCVYLPSGVKPLAHGAPLKGGGEFQTLEENEVIVADEPHARVHYLQPCVSHCTAVDKVNNVG